MSRRNREKRAAKQKARRSAAAPPGSSGFFTTNDHALLRARMTEAIRLAAVCTCDGIDEHATDIVTTFAGAERDLDAATDSAVGAMLGESWRRGWQPLDVVEATRRRTTPALAGFVGEAILVESRRYAPARVHPRWHQQVEGVGAAVPTPSANESHLRSWRTRAGLDHQAALSAALQVLSLLCRLGVLERLLPLPGECSPTAGATPVGEVDQRALGRVRALLAKAESSTYPEEAEALSAKAQELMSRYSLHHAVQEHADGRVPVVSGRRFWLEAPYLDAKALLVHEVAKANRARAVWSSGLGFATVIGADADLDAIELLTTSLLVQANRAMLAEGSQITRAGTSRTRSFRQSFLIAYATRIGERLAAADSTAVADVEVELGTSASEPRADDRLLPVLAARASATDAYVEERFPHLVQKGYSVTNPAGWTAGRAAADQARIGVRGAIAG